LPNHTLNETQQGRTTLELKPSFLEVRPIAEVAAVPPLSEATVRPYIRLGTLPSITLGRRRFIYQTELEKFIARESTAVSADCAEARKAVA
jgi:hypothetical protein